MNEKAVLLIQRIEKLKKMKSKWDEMMMCKKNKE